MSGDDWCSFPGCEQEEEIGTCDRCGKSVCPHHAVILADDDWRCRECSEVKQEEAVGYGALVFLSLIFASLCGLWINREYLLAQFISFLHWMGIG